MKLQSSLWWVTKVWNGLAAAKRHRASCKHHAAFVPSELTSCCAWIPTHPQKQHVWPGKHDHGLEASNNLLVVHVRSHGQDTQLAAQSQGEKRVRATFVVPSRSQAPQDNFQSCQNASFDQSKGKNKIIRTAWNEWSKFGPADTQKNPAFEAVGWDRTHPPPATPKTQTLHTTAHFHHDSSNQNGKRVHLGRTPGYFSAYGGIFVFFFSQDLVLFVGSALD